MANSKPPDYDNYTKRVAENSTLGALKEGEYYAIVKHDKKRAKKYFRASGATSKNEETAIRQATKAGDDTVALKHKSKSGRTKKRATKR